MAIELDKPLVSVVTVTYRNFDCIYEVIDSVLAQKYPNIEFIISDDGSDNFPGDELEAYISDHKGSNIVRYSVYTAEHNRGTVRNLNDAYRKASGEYLISLAGDDSFYNADVIDRIVSAFNEKACDVLVTRRMICDENGREIEALPSDKDIQYITNLRSAHQQHIAFLTSEFYNMASGSALYLRRSFFEEWGGFDEKYTLWEDGPFLTQYTLRHPITTEYGITSIKYRLGGVSTGKFNPIMRRDMQLYNHTDRAAEESQLPAQVRRKIRYLRERSDTRSVWKILWLYLSFPDVVIGMVMYEIRRRRR